MKVSMYNVFVEGSDEETILFNTLCGSMVTLNPSTLCIVKEILGNPSIYDDGDIYNVLVEQKYLIEDSVDEIEIIKQRKMAGIKDHNRLDLIIMPTLDCNFACTYCYETHIPSRMSDETEEAIKKWVGLELPNYKFLMLHWFGGEPLLGYKRVLSITPYIRDTAARLGISYVTHMTTNGYLLTPNRISELLDCGIFDFQITVDGPPETHNKLRVLRNGQGTFERIFQNIVQLAQANEKVKISLRVNFNHSNLHQIPILINMFPIEIRNQLRIVYEPIFGGCALSATDNMPSEEISNAMTKYYQLAESLGYDVVLGTNRIHPGKLVYCYAERENQFIINYNADVYKCSVSKFTSENRVAYITQEGVMVKENKNWERWVGLDLFESKCYSCVYLPLCMGGCRKMRMEQKSTGSYCSLVSTNASYLLKQVALGSFATLLRDSSGMY